MSMVSPEGLTRQLTDVQAVLLMKSRRIQDTWWAIPFDERLLNAG
jgi:hypothetical protein